VFCEFEGNGSAHDSAAHNHNVVDFHAIILAALQMSDTFKLSADE
jgi:hypothetical protein